MERKMFSLVMHRIFNALLRGMYWITASFCVSLLWIISKSTSAALSNKSTSAGYCSRHFARSSSNVLSSFLDSTRICSSSFCLSFFSFSSSARSFSFILPLFCDKELWYCDSKWLIFFILPNKAFIWSASFAFLGSSNLRFATFMAFFITSFL